VDLKARDEHAARRAARYTAIIKRCEAVQHAVEVCAVCDMTGCMLCVVKRVRAVTLPARAGEGRVPISREERRLVVVHVCDDRIDCIHAHAYTHASARVHPASVDQLSA
jgi:hypothetical protein